MLLQLRRVVASPATPLVGGQIVLEPDDEFCFHGREPGREHADLDRRLLHALVTLLTPDRPDSRSGSPSFRRSAEM